MSADVSKLSSYYWGGNSILESVQLSVPFKDTFKDMSHYTGDVRARSMDLNVRSNSGTAHVTPLTNDLQCMKLNENALVRRWIERPPKGDAPTIIPVATTWWWPARRPTRRSSWPVSTAPRAPSPAPLSRRTPRPSPPPSCPCCTRWTSTSESLTAATH